MAMTSDSDNQNRQILFVIKCPLKLLQYYKIYIKDYTASGC